MKKAEEDLVGKEYAFTLLNKMYEKELSLTCPFTNIAAHSEHKQQFFSEREIKDGVLEV